MTYDEAVNMKSYKHYCNCGGFALKLSGRDAEHPHRPWCAQYAEFEERAAALAARPSPPRGKHP